jgi:hypothetical protein
MLARLVLCSLLVLALGAARAEAQTFTVSNSSDADPGSLRALVAGAGDGDTVLIPASITSPIVLTSGAVVIKKSITITGAGASLSVVDGNNADRVFDVSDDGVTHPAVTIADLTITHGKTTTLPGGGGVVLRDSDTLHLTRVLVTANSTIGGDAGGGVSDRDGTLTIDHSTISGNTSGSDGGGVATITLQVASAPLATISDSTVSGNTTPFGRSGGGIANTGTMTIERSTISGNTAGRGGGGVVSQNTLGPGALTLVDSTVTGNHAPTGGFEGGGVYINAGSAGGVLLLNDTVVGNTGAPDTMMHPGSSGGIANRSEGTMIFNTIVAGNSGKVGSDNCDQFVPLIGDHNLEDADTCHFQAPGNLVNTDPLLTALGDNGGPTLTLQPIPNSPAIGAADAARCPATDQRGVPYFAPNPCDIGAVDTARPGPPAIAGPPPLAEAAISRLGMRPSKFAAAGRGGSIARKHRRRTGTAVSYTQLVAGKTGFVVRAPRRGVRSQAGKCVRRTRHHRHGRRCTLFVKVGGFSRGSSAGANRFHFTGRVRRHKLRPGRYRLDATATAAAKRRTVRHGFRIVP